MDGVINTVIEYLSNISRNVQASFKNMTPEKYIRLVMVVGAYLLLRPYLVKVGARIQEKQHEKEWNTKEVPEQAGAAHESLRGQVEGKMTVDSDDEVEGAATGAEANWGKKARKRQKQMAKRILEAEEKLRVEQEEEESDKEIEQFLQENYGVSRLEEEK